MTRTPIKFSLGDSVHAFIYGEYRNATFLEYYDDKFAYVEYVVESEVYKVHTEYRERKRKALAKVQVEWVRPKHFKKWRLTLKTWLHNKV